MLLTPGFLGVALAAAALVPSQATAAFPGLNGQIAFVGYPQPGDTPGDIFVMNPDGSGQTNLTNSPARDDSPAWSPDGRRIAFQSNTPQGLLEVLVMNADGSGTTNLTNNSANDYEPAWSPDGRRIAFTSSRGGDEEIWVMNADGTGPVNLTRSGGRDFEAAWSPDGTRIAFVSYRTNDFEVFVMNADGSGQRNLTNAPDAVDEFPDWSPDGTRIAFDSSRDGDADIFTMNADGSDPVNQTSIAGSDSAPTWSPDGRRIAFMSQDDVFAFDLETSDPEINLTRSATRDRVPAWGAVPPPSAGPAPGGGSAPGGGAAPGLAAPSGGATGDRAAPVLSRLSMSRTAVRPGVGRGLGTTLTYRLSEPARVIFTIQRALPGRRVGGVCRAATRANRAKPRCLRFSALGALLQNGTAGLNTRAFSARLAGRALAPGSYRALARATDAAGNRSAPATISFRVIG